jgi:hypothetical protein
MTNHELMHMAEVDHKCNMCEIKYMDEIWQHGWTVKLKRVKLTDGIIYIKYLYHTLDEFMLMEFSMSVKKIQIFEIFHSPNIARW